MFGTFFTITPTNITDMLGYVGNLVADVMPLLIVILGVLLVGVILEIIFSLRK